MIRLPFRIPVFSLEPDTEGYEELRLRIAAGIISALGAVERAARERAPVRTGRLRDSIRAYFVGEGEGVLEATAPYAAYLHMGTGIYGPAGRSYTIRPRARRALFWPGAAHPVRRVVVRGIKPRDFLRRAVDDALVARAFDEGFLQDIGRDMNS